jgi:hypothetical protein
LPAVAGWAVQAREETPPAGIEPIEGLLLTTCAVHTVEEATTRVEGYACRWGMEIFQATTTERVLFMAFAWRKNLEARLHDGAWATAT